ncbi:MAG: cadherin repeat domain-containing protein, partial [Candidatus Thioglobus sp.]
MYPGSVAENAAIGDIVRDVLLRDVLIYTGNPTAFSITTGNTNNAFSINNSGQITVAGALDFETTQSYTLTVQASQDGVDVTATVVIIITNINENTLTISGSRNFSIAENNAANAPVGTLTITGNPTVNLTGTGSEKFAITPAGVITALNPLDYETKQNYQLTVTATKDDAETKTAEITITITNVYLPLTISGFNSAYSVVENTSFRVTPTPITGASWGGGSGLFSVNPFNGTVTSDDPLAFDDANPANNVHTLTVIAGTNASNGNESGRGTYQITITVIEALTIANATLSINENATNGTAVGAPLVATGNPTAFSITTGNPLSNGSRVFAINDSGQISVSNTLDYETTPSYTLTVEISKDGAPNVTAQITITITHVNEDGIN